MSVGPIRVYSFYYFIHICTGTYTILDFVHVNSFYLLNIMYIYDMFINISESLGQKGPISLFGENELHGLSYKTFMFFIPVVKWVYFNNYYR